MPTEIRVVLPTPGFDEVLSVADDELSVGEDEEPMGNDVSKFNNHVGEKKNADGLTAANFKKRTKELDILKSSAAADGTYESRAQKLPLSTGFTDSDVPSSFGDEENIFCPDSSSAQTLNEQLSKHVSNQHQIFGDENVRSKAQRNAGRSKEEREEGNGLQRAHSATQTDASPVMVSTAEGSKVQQKKSAGIRSKCRKSQKPTTTDSQLLENVKRRKAKKKSTESVKMSVTGTYDLDLEHHDIMVKALNSYRQHYSRDARTPKFKDLLADDTILHVDGATCSPREKEDGSSVLDSTFSSSSIEQEIKVGRAYDYDSLVAQLLANNFNIKRTSSDSTEQHENRKNKDGHIGYTTDNSNNVKFKLAQCRLIYNDEKKRQQTRPKSAALSEKSSKSLDLSGGVFVDSVGHVYGQSKPRPWSALPYKFSSFLKTAGTAAGSEQVKDFKRVRADSNSRNSSFRSGQVKVVTLQPPHDAMAQPIARSVAFNRRNRTTFSWADSAGMSQSLPNASFLHKQYTCSQPRIGTPRSASPTSRAGKPSFSQRPSSSYSYDGGFFLGAHSGQAEYFVIHPDWVSEALTIRKLSGNKTDEEKIKSFNRKPPQRRWSDRRCLSAPPPKFRNPITWDATDTVTIPNV